MYIRAKRVLGVFVMSLLLCILLPDRIWAEDKNMNIYCIYLGEADDNAGDSVLVESDGEYLLMDLGSAAGYSYIKAFLQERGVKELSLYISHTHADHTGGLKDGEGYDQLLGDFEVKHVYLPDKSIGTDVDLSWNHSKFISLYQKHYPAADINQNITYLKTGSEFSFGDVAVNVIGPVGMENRKVSDYSDENTYLNNCSLVSMLTCGNTKYFSGGDIDTDEEKMLAKTYGSALKADIYKMSHHGYANSSTQEIMDCIQPTYSFAPSSGDANGFTSASTTNQRKSYAALLRCSQYGFVYLVGAEKMSVAVNTTNDVTKIYRTNNMAQNLSGYIAVEGADGRDVTQDHYLFGADGRPMTGVQEVNGKKYYFGTGGRQEYGLYKNGTYNPWRSYTDGGKKKFRYYDQKTHEMMTGLVEQSKSKIYYCDVETGFRSYGFIKVDKNTYYFGNAGTMYKNKWLTYKKNRYYFKKNGIMATGWVKIGKTKTYFNEDGTRSKGLTKIGKKYYYMNNTGTTKKVNYSIKLDGVTLKFNHKGVLENVPTSKKTKISSVNATGNTITVKWKKVAKASGYTIYISDSEKIGYTEIASVKKNKKTVKIENLTSGRYYVKVASYKSIGGIKFYSKMSGAKVVNVQ